MVSTLPPLPARFWDQEQHPRGTGGRFAPVAEGSTAVAERAADVTPPAGTPPPDAGRSMETLADARAVYDGHYGGLTARVTSAPGPNAMRQMIIKGEITDADGQPVGEFMRTFDARDGSVHHDALFINERHQGTGFAAAWNAHAFTEYERRGYHTVTLEANSQVGGFTWARQGFDFVRDSDRRNMLSRLDWETSRPGIPPAVRAEYDRLGAGHPATAFEISEVGKAYMQPGPHGGTWAGKRALLQENWQGIKHLGPVTHGATFAARTASDHLFTAHTA